MSKSQNHSSLEGKSAADAKFFGFLHKAKRQIISINPFNVKNFPNFYSTGSKNVRRCRNNICG